MFPEAIKEVVENLSKLPGIGKKTAFRLTFFLINSNANYVATLAKSIMNLKQNIGFCKKCFNFVSNAALCEICSNSKRDFSKLCVVETVVDLYSIEKTAKFNGIYHVLHGSIAPIDGIFPENIKIKELLKRIINEPIDEVIIATNPTSEGNATASYIIEQIEKMPQMNITLTRIASGIPVGSEIEYIDNLTLGEAFLNRRMIKGCK